MSANAGAFEMSDHKKSPTKAYIGNWAIHQDSPAFGCADNPSGQWIATEFNNGHWTGNILRAPTYDELVDNLEQTV